MYRFQISAATQPGETIALVGSIPEMGMWDVGQCVRLHTSGDRYPLWWVDLDLKQAASGHPDECQAEYKRADYKAEYKYVRIRADGRVDWEAGGANRWVPIESEPFSSPVIVEDGVFGTIAPYPYGYVSAPLDQALPPQHQNGLKVVVIGSSVALGCNAWLLRGWAWHLGQALQQHYGHQLVNVSEIGTNVSTTIDRFPQVVPPEKPDIVIIALSLGNEGLAVSAPHQHRAIQRRFETGLQQLIKMTREIGALPVLGGVYPNGGYSAAHYTLLQETHQRMLTWGVPVLDWLAAVDDGQGRWLAGTFSDPAHPNTRGHQLMYEAIDLSLFQLTQADLTTIQGQPPKSISIYQDHQGFELGVQPIENNLQIRNTSPYYYTLTPNWQALQSALQTARLSPGMYLADHLIPGTQPFLIVQDDGTIATKLTIPPSTTLQFCSAFHGFAPQRSQVLFHEGHLAILKVQMGTGNAGADYRLYVINESDHEYNLHPMWKEVRAALKAMPAGVYEDPIHPDVPFRTLMISQDGLESRIKVPAQSAIVLDYQCSLSDRSRVAILPLGDRCAVRMLLYKLEYDGPAFPFDLTRTTHLADVADMIHQDFHDMWNPACLQYNHDARRIYHTKWTGLSFAHEVEESDNPVQDMAPVYERMRVRYTARAKRFGYTLQKCDKALFIRTGSCDRGTVMDLVS
ncbi:MAG TPA: DUF1796 family putative cysteine peptidase, partial [Allocoleopsis sp.]